MYNHPFAPVHWKTEGGIKYYTCHDPGSAPYVSNSEPDAIINDSQIYKEGPSVKKKIMGRRVPGMKRKVIGMTRIPTTRADSQRLVHRSNSGRQAGAEILLRGITIANVASVRYRMWQCVMAQREQIAQNIKKHGGVLLVFRCGMDACAHPDTGMRKVYPRDLYMLDGADDWRDVFNATGPKRLSPGRQGTQVQPGRNATAEIVADFPRPAHYVAPSGLVSENYYLWAQSAAKKMQ